MIDATEHYPIKELSEKAEPSQPFFDNELTVTCMKYIITLCSLLLNNLFLSKAQNTFDANGGCLNVVDFTIGQPMGSYGDRSYSLTYQHEVFVNEKFTIGAGIGYSYHDKFKYSAIPFFISSHYFFVDKRFSPFVNLKIGTYGMFGTKNVGAFEKYSLADKDHDQTFNFYFSPGAGIKAHITPNVGVIASVTDEAYLVKAFDVSHKDYRSKLSHSLGLNIGICFQIKGW
ncbi:MAG: hypothetical protein J6I72_00930 [Muribaculaceae bacterium]|nr:hypothetical protein [Muribaculaceae bacterium]